MSDSRHFALFLAVWDEGSFSRAARKLRCSQPTISRAISELEGELGARLFSRTTRNVTPTEAARALEPAARRGLGALDAGMAMARQAGSGQLGTLRIGHTSTVPFHPAFAWQLSRLRSELPDLRLEIRERASGEQLADLEAGELDLGWVRPDQLPKRGGLVARRIDLEKVYVALPRQHPLASHRRLCLAELENQPLVVPDPSLGSSLGRLLAGTLAARAHPAQPPAQPVVMVRHVATILPLVAAGLGLALLPASLARTRLLPREGVRCIPLLESSARLPLFLVRRASDRRSEVLRVSAMAIDAWRAWRAQRAQPSAVPPKHVTSSSSA